MKKYSISKNVGSKKLDVKLMGRFGEADVADYMKEFEAQIKGVTVPDYEITFDAEELEVSTQEMLPLLEGCFALYKSLGFKKVNVITGKNIVLKMQVRRIAGKAELTSIYMLD